MSKRRIVSAGVFFSALLAVAFAQGFIRYYPPGSTNTKILGMSTAGIHYFATQSGPFGGHATLTNGLVPYWKMNEESGPRVDAHGSNNLTDNNAVGFAAGKSGNAASFVAASSQSLSAAAPALGDTDWTVAGWVYRNGLGVDTLASRGNATPQCILRGDGGTENLTLFTRGAADSVTKSGGFTAGAWHFVVGWHDSVNNLIGVSLDGGVAVTAATGGANTSTSDSLFIGGWDGHNYHDGLIDETAIWSRVLTAQERTDLWAAGAGLFYGS